MTFYFIKNFKKKVNRKFFTILLNNPFKKGTIIKVLIITPKKPNSARRPVAKVLLNNNYYCLSYIPGIGHNLKKHCLVLIRKGGARDLPGVSYTCVRGVYDFLGITNKNKRRSIYGSKRNDNLKKKIRKKFRQ
jgi:small subunit ribosomal protein S12